MISLTHATVMRGPQVLLEGADLVIHKGRKLGVIGRNGSGKSSLFACLRGELALDAGTLSVPAGLRLASMAQELPGSTRSALDAVIDGDTHFRRLEAELLAAEHAGDTAAIATLHGALDATGAYDIRVRAAKLLAGLGFAPDTHARSVAEFSGGWRVRLSLAAALMAPSDLLLLDEPTNHLDLETTVWLEQWLRRYDGTLLLISHDRDFLDQVIDGVVSFEGRTLQTYRGTYSDYERQRAERMALQQAMQEKQQRRRAEIEQFVRRFRAKASKARQAQSRLRALERMETLSVAHVDSPFEFHIPSLPPIPDFLLTARDLAVGYDSPLIQGINLTVRSDTRIGLLGLNGSGKSTLLNVLAGQLAPLSGTLERSKGVRVGYFAQHQVDVLDLNDRPLDLLQRVRPAEREQSVRDYLGGFDFRGDRVLEPVANFSGGEKVRLALALMTWQAPNLLLLDEPSNHLDLDMRHALTVALQNFAGAILLIAHDRHLLANTVDGFLAVQGGRLQPYDGDLKDYERSLLAEPATPGRTAPAANGQGANRRLQRQQDAQRREQTAPLRKQLQALEREVQRLERVLAELDAQLADPQLYDGSANTRVATLLQQQGDLRRQLTETEDAWLSLSAELDAAD